MLVRKAEFKDLDSLLKLYEELDGYHIENMKDVIKNIDEDFRRNMIIDVLSQNDYIFAAAEEDNKVVGFLLGVVREIKGHPVMKDKKYLNIFDLVVGKQFRRRGIASNLMVYAEKFARDAKLDYIELQVYEFNDAREFYDNTGFSTAARRMQKQLLY